MASHQIEWKRSAVKELEKLPRPYIPKIVAAVKELSKNPYPQGMKNLVGSEHTYRIREGDYRRVYEVFENRLVVQIVRVRHRKDAYR
ncbi:MAG TPA: type II toxin-antitoxin system RelE/ParE family toxin [Acidobacteriota bacterium]|nr:type II toxin-antitoxin system RelE/ParE family toxin [Acidobacteriota bacterium]